MRPFSGLRSARVVWYKCIFMGDKQMFHLSSLLKVAAVLSKAKERETIAAAATATV